MTAAYVNLARAGATLATLTIYPLMLVLPSQSAWENHAIENSQVAVLIAGCVAAIAFSGNSKDQWRWFWLITAVIWFLLVGRELSWGATFYPPTSMTRIGPFFSARELWYWPAVYPLIGFLCLVMLFIAIRYRTWEKCGELVRNGTAPVVEMALAVVLFVVSLSGEGRAGPLSAIIPHSMVLEELSELTAYIWLFTAQLVVEDSRLRLMLD